MGANAPGKMFLKVTGILLIIGGVLSAIASLLVLAGGGVAGYVASQGGVEGLDAGTMATGSFLLVFIGIIGLIGGAFNLVAGILGVKNANKLEKAQTCFIMGIIMIVLQAINLLMTLFGGDIDFTVILSSLAGFVLPVLYLVGASKNKAAANSNVA